MPGFLKRLRREESSIAQRLADVSRESDALVTRMKASDLANNQAFAQHEQLYRSVRNRFWKSAAWAELPKRVIAAAQKAAFMETTRKERLRQ